MTLYDLLKLVKSHLLLVVVLPVACAVAMAGVAFGFMPNQYTASSSIYVLSKSDSSSTNFQSDLAASQLITNDVAALLKSQRVTEDAAEALGLPDLKAFEVAVTSATTNRIITISVTGEDPALTARVTNALTDSVSEVVREVMDVRSVNVVDEAKAPIEPSGPKRFMYVAVAFMAGLFLAIAIIVLMDMLNTRVRTAAELEELLGVAVIGRMPMVKEGM